MNGVRELRTDTQAVLLLCGYFGRAGDGTVKPLAGGEYSRLAKWLIERKRRPADLLEMAESELEDLVEAKLDPSRVRMLLQRGAALALAAEKWLRSGLWVISRSDDAYPKRLKKLLGIDAPPILYGAGDVQLLLSGGLAVVGSRNASESSLEFARAVSGRCGVEGLAVVSGGARGIDSAAMQAAGEAGGVVLGVLAEALLQAIRNRHNRIGIEARKLVLVSPFYPEAGFNAGNAMARNRCIYALADYALVVQSDFNKGGTWAGATENLREGWVPVFVWRELQSAGNRELIRKGARPFDYDPRTHDSLRTYLESRTEQQESELFSRGAGETITAKQETAEYRTVPPTSTTTAPDLVARIPLDLYEEFLIRLNAVLADKPMSPKDIGKSLGLEAAQVRAWLRKAEVAGAVETRGKAKKYALVQRRLFE